MQKMVALSWVHIKKKSQEKSYVAGLESNWPKLERGSYKNVFSGSQKGTVLKLLPIPDKISLYLFL